MTILVLVERAAASGVVKCDPYLQGARLQSPPQCYAPEEPEAALEALN